MDRKHQLKRKMVSEDGYQIKRRSKPMEDKAGPSTATPEEGCFKFDVFISFRGEDTRNGFTSHLHKELKNRGIKTFIDSEDLEKGKRISDLFKYMEGSKIFVPVFSKNYADSKWCLREIAKMVEIYEREAGKRDIIPVFYDVEPAVVKHCTGSFGGAFEKHQRDKRLDDMQINEWKAALTKAAEFSRHNAQRTEAELITLIGNEVSHILCNVPFDIQLVGIGPRIDTLKQMLQRERDGVCMIGICGMGGIGKTTFAMALYNQLFLRFESSCFLSDIRERLEDLHALQAKFMNKVFGGNMTVDNVEQGVSFIKERFKSNKVLLVLDDVDHICQLEAFTANRGKKQEWFGAGSKIIVTTRDKKVLLDHGLQEDDIYFPKELNFEDSLQLFCHHAFFGNKPPERFEELSREVVKVTQYLPLALEVFGPLFCDLKEIQEWEEMLEKLKRDQDKKVYERLKISYDGLDEHAKSVFLDIACFFIKKEKEYAVYMWEACNYLPTATLEVLQHKSLIKIDNGRFEMHDQIRDMGIMIVKEKGNFDPRKYSRPCSNDQVLEVLMDAKVSRGNPDVQGIDFQKVEDEVIKMSWEVIEAMSSLRMIVGANGHHCFEDQEDIIRLPSNLRWFQWHNCPYQMLAFYNDQHEKLCILDLQGDDFRDFRSHSMKFPNLKVFNLRRCWQLIRTPDFAGLKSLEVLTLDWCTSLVDMDESIGHLEKLVNLSVSHCWRLKGVPAGLCKLTSLESLDLYGCDQISVLPTRIGDLISLRELRLAGTSISALPDSIRSLESLETLDLAGCKRIFILPKQIGGLTSLKYLKLQKTSISALPDSIGSLESLETLNLEGCERISALPKQIGDLTSLKDLNLTKTSISALPDSIGRLRSLLKLNLAGCTRMSILPKQRWGLTSLKYLGLHGTSISALPYSIRSLQSLEELDLEKCEGISSLPKQIGDLRSLKYLKLNGTSISALPDSIGNLQFLEHLDLSECSSLESLTDSIGGLKSLSALSLYRCGKLEQLPNSMGMLTSLKKLDIRKCASLREVPDSLGDLNNVLQIALKDCISLETFPNSIIVSAGDHLEFDGWKSLRRLPDSLGDGISSTVRFLSFNGCKSLEKIPESIGMRLECLEELDLSGCTLLTRIPQSIGNLKSLKRFILNRCQSLEELPESIGDLKRLRHLSLEECRSLKELPESMEGLKSLEELHIDGGMSIKKTPDFIGKLTSLRTLYLKEIEEIPDSIGVLKSLEELHLSACRSLRMIPESIGELNCLKHLLLLNCQSLEKLPESMEGLKSLETLYICGGMSVNKELPRFLYPSMRRPKTLVLSELEEITVLVGGFPPMEVILIEDCPKLVSLPQLPSSLTRLEILGCAAFRKLPDLSTLSCLMKLCLAGCKALTDLTGLGSLKSLRELALIDRDGLSGDLMEKLSQTSFQKLERLLIYGVSDGSDLLFPLPKSKTGHIVALQGGCSLTEKLWFNTSDIEIRIQVVVEGKTVDEVKCKANRKDDGAEELGMWGLGVRVSYKISIEEGHKILMCVKEGNPTWTSDIEEKPTCTSEIEEEDYHPEAHKMLGLEEGGKRVRIGGWGMLRVPTNESYGRLSMAFFEVTYGDGSTSSSRMVRSY